MVYCIVSGLLGDLVLGLVGSERMEEEEGCEELNRVA